MITVADFEQWLKLPVTEVILKHLKQEEEDYAHIDTTLAQKAGQLDEVSVGLDLERIGLDSAMRASVVEGLRLITDLDGLFEDLKSKKLIALPEGEDD